METEANRQSYREGKQRLRSVRWMLFWIAAVQTAVAMVVAVVASFFSVPPPFWVQMLLVELFAYLLPLSFYARENRLLSAKTARERFGLKRCRNDLWIYVILGGIGCQFVMLVLNLPINLLLSQGESVVPRNLTELLAALVVVAVIPAVFEEFLFRGIVYGVMKEFNTRAAMIFTTLLFALMHGSITGFLGYLFLGWAAVEILRRTGSMYACMGFHLANNVTAVLLSRYSGELLYYPMGTLWLFLGGILAAVLGFLGIRNMTTPAPKTNLMRCSDLLGQSFSSLPVLLCILCLAGVWILG
ncbi:MAG: CPBP family intramembrane metalloprotease [Clostridia bacterium]|nr:CPBP family intramembrane metalloprotease [Clostridia bacterium]